MSFLVKTFSGWDPQAVFSSQVQKVNMVTEPDVYTLPYASKRKGHRYAHSQQEDNDDDDYNQRLVPEPQPHDSLSEPVFVRRSISTKQRGLFDSLDRSTSFVASSSSKMKSHTRTSLNESSCHNTQEYEKVKEIENRWTAARTIQKHVRGHLGRCIAAKQQLFQERNRLKSRQRRQQLLQETVQHQHQQSRKQRNIPSENPTAETMMNRAPRSSNSIPLVAAPIDDDNADMLEDSLMIRRSGEQFHVINQSISNNQKKQISSSEWIEMQEEEEDNSVPVPETSESFNDNDERMHVLEDSLVDCRNDINATDGKTALTNTRCSTTTVTTTIQPPPTSCTATTAATMTATSSVVPCTITSQRSTLSQPVHVVTAKVTTKSTISTQQQQQQQQHKNKAVITSQQSSLLPSSTQPKQLPSSTPYYHFPPSVVDLLEATGTITTIEIIPTPSQQSHASQSKRRQSLLQTTQQQPPPQLPQQQQQQPLPLPLPLQSQMVAHSASTQQQGTRARARSVSCARGSQHSQSSQQQQQQQMVVIQTLTPRQPQSHNGHHRPSAEFTNTTATVTTTTTATAITATAEVTTSKAKNKNIGVTVNVAAMVPPPPTTIPSSSCRTSQVGHRHKGPRTAQGQSNIRHMNQSNLPVKSIAEVTINDEQKLLEELYELEHRQQQKLQDMMKIKNSELHNVVSTSSTKEGETPPRRGVLIHACKDQNVSRGNQENMSENKQEKKEEKRELSRLRCQQEHSNNKITTSTPLFSNNNNHNSNLNSQGSRGVTKAHLDREKKAFKPGARDVRNPSPTFVTATHNQHHATIAAGKCKSKGKDKMYNDTASSASTTTTTTTTKSHTHLSSTPALPYNSGISYGGGVGGVGVVQPHSNHHVEMMKQSQCGDGNGSGRTDHHCCTSQISRGLGIAEMQGGGLLPCQGMGSGPVGGGVSSGMGIAGMVSTAAAAYGCVNLLPGMAPGYLLEYQKKRSTSVGRTRKISSTSASSMMADDHSVVSALTLHTAGIPR